MNINTQLYYTLPKGNNLAAVLSQEEMPLLVYAALYTDSLTDDGYDGLTNEDGLKLFITPDVESYAKDAGITASNILSIMDGLHKRGLIRVVKQQNGKPPVVFLNSIGEQFITSGAAKTEPLPMPAPAKQKPEKPVKTSPPAEEQRTYTEEEIEIYGCWEEAFSVMPNDDQKAILSNYLENMKPDLVMLAIFDSEGDSSVVFPKLEGWAEAGIESVDDFQGGDEIEIPEPEPVPKKAKGKVKEPEQPAEPEKVNNTNTQVQENATLTVKVNQPDEEVSQGHKSPPQTATPASRTDALREACNGEFLPSDMREIWVSMQNVIDEGKWEDCAYLRDWLSSKYAEMDSQAKGGNDSVRLGMLHDVIAKG